MKPRIETRFPITDHNYQSVALSGRNGSCARLGGPSFRNISRGYFENEARHDFVAEGLSFAAIVLTVMPALMSGAYALAHFIR